MKPPEPIEYKPIAPEVEAALDKQEAAALRHKDKEISKKEKELGKIKAFDLQLANMAREQRQKKLQQKLQEESQSDTESVKSE